MNRRLFALMISIAWFAVILVDRAQLLTVQAQVTNPSNERDSVNGKTTAAEVQFSLANFTVNENLGTATINVALSAPSGQTISVNYATSDGTAHQPDDYMQSSGTLTFAPNVTSQTFTVSIINNAVNEDNKILNLALSAPNNAFLGASANATLMIVDDEGLPTLQFASTSYRITENEASGGATISVILNHPSPSVITIHYTTNDGSATTGNDYTAVSGTLTFPANVTSQSFIVPLTNDNIFESDETINLILSAPNPPTIELGVPGNTAILTIVNDDPSVFSCNNTMEIPSSECDALIALYNSTNGPNWKNHTRWLATNTPCSWYGVFCGNSHVSTLNLSDNQLIGTIPPELGNLANMTGLSLYSNQLNGNIPPQLSNLTHLALLLLSNNQLSGNIPVELGNLAGMQMLNLDGNKLNGNIPIQFENLSNLIALSVSGNQLSGSIPIQLGTLTNLTYLFIDNNQFSGALPSSLVNLTKLDTFSFNNTSLCEPNDAAFQSWLASILHLSRTSVTCTAPPTNTFTPTPSATSTATSTPIPGGNNFQEDFSSNPDTNGHWQIFREANDSGVWDTNAGMFYLTRDVRWQSAIMFANYTMTSHSWNTSFHFKAGGQSNGVCGDQGGDGITFFFYANTFVPGSGRIPPPAQGYTIKLDSYTGRTCDVIPEELIDYITIMKGDTILTAVQDNRVEDNQSHTLNITFDNGAVVVSVDNSPVINYQIQNPDYTFSSMGFNAITGNASNDQIIDDFVFSPVTAPICVSPNTNLDVCQLQKGDILLVKDTFNLLRQAVRMVVGTYWYHVAIYVGDGYLAEAAGPDPLPVAEQVRTVKIYDTPWWTGDGLNDWVVIRPRTTDTIKTAAADYAKEKADPPDIPYNNNYFDKDNENAFYCSQLPWKAYKRQNQGPDLEVNKGILTKLFGPVVTPDDLYYSVTEGRADVVQEDTSVSNNFERWVFGIFSPANMLLVDPLGRRVGYDSVTQQIINEIPNAGYIGPDGEVEALSVAISNTNKEGWKLIVTGTGNGTYTLATEVLDVHNPVDQTLTFETSPGHVDVFQIVNPNTHPGELIRQISQIFLPLVQR